MSSIQGAERVTESDSNDQLLYFTSTSLLAGDRGLVFISDRTGAPNLFCLDFGSGETQQLTQNRESAMKSYVYFDGTPYRGFGKASASFDPAGGVVYYIQGLEVRAVDLDGNERVLAELPHGEMTAFTHVSADGTRLCVPTTDARALDDEAPLPAEDPDYDVDARVEAEGLSSYLRVYDTATGEQLQRVPVPRAWITHVQFAPDDSSIILYNHEYSFSRAGVGRMWLWNGVRHTALRDPSAPGAPGRVRSREDWITHEMWERDGSYVVYHGGFGREFHEPPCFVGRVSRDRSERSEVLFPEGWNLYGHFTVGPPGRLVTDGYYQTPDTAHGWAGHWIALADVDWDGETVEWRGLVKHGSSWASQDEHPHPIFNHACDAVYFTSDQGGRRAVYRVEV